jgi:tagatose-6-phosphate ketose/aldose isomerase
MSHLSNKELMLFNNDEGGKYTAQEITAQPKTWNKTWTKIHKEKKGLTTFLNEPLSSEHLQIVLTGAGSSAFIGDSAVASWNKTCPQTARAIPTTDLVTHFDELIDPAKPLLLISFARSGNSPESTATIRLANERCNGMFHLIITCNPKGELGQLKDRDNTYIFLLPPEAEDQSLAMTNSFTSMSLAAVLIPQIITEPVKEEQINRQIEILVQYGQRLVEDFSEILREVSETDFNKIVFLGSGNKWGIARESHLKVQELTNGEVIGKYDTFLGFRHGPKAIIDEQTLLVYLLSNKEEIHQYERDLISQIQNHEVGLTTLAVSERPYNITKSDYTITLGEETKLEDCLWAIACTIPAQIIGFYKSLALGYNPDNPSPDGTISRVVEGVTIYNKA